MEVNDRKSIIESYVNVELDDIKDDLIKSYVVDRNKAKQIVEGVSTDLKQYLDQIQRKAAKLQATISDSNGIIKYVDSKIVERHIELENNN